MTRNQENKYVRQVLKAALQGAAISLAIYLIPIAIALTALIIKGCIK